MIRPVVAVILMLVLTFAGVGRGWAAASVAPDVLAQIGISSVPICHSGSDGGSTPDFPVHQDCCDQCALFAPAVLPSAPLAVSPASVTHVIAHAKALAWAPVLARTRTPRLSQGPPAA